MKVNPVNFLLLDQLNLSDRYDQYTDKHSWVFWHRYCSSKDGSWKEGPFQDRKKIIKSLCQKADIRYVRFHALRHGDGHLWVVLGHP